MAVLPVADQQKIWRGLMRFWSYNREPVAIVKSDIMDAVVAMDSFLDANAATINNAFPAPAKANLTVGQKAIIFAVVALARWNPILLNNILGSVD